MLQIEIPDREYYDESKGEFVYTKAVSLQLEHSLVSLSRWESKWKKPFLNQDKPLSREELIDYVRCMTINHGVPHDAYYGIGPQELVEIQNYIGDPHTATTIHDKRQTGIIRNETITSELIYYWMIACDIPISCEKWHLNRLLTLIKICNIKQTPEKKMSKSSVYAQNRALNAMRKQKMNSRG